ncbi:MAG TPA: hypothetical protein VGC65_00300 [Bacteroidia bacterium]|jgi:hypothetical protein
MRDFKSLNIKPPTAAYNGKKIEVEDILNKQIAVIDFRIELSKFPKKAGDQCMHMQVKVDDQERVVFTIAKRLIATMGEVKDKSIDLPFKTTIVKQDKRYEFT